MPIACELVRIRKDFGGTPAEIMLNGSGYGFGAMTQDNASLYYGTYTTGTSAPYSAI